MSELPVSQVLPEIKHRLAHHNRLILQAPPGAGKTTLVPLALLDQPWLKNKQIIMLEPRRLATRNSARRMAQMLGEKVGETVGYQIRQDRCFSKKTRILVVTEGILTRKLQADPELAGIALVIFDEFHERSIHADLSLAFCLQSQELLNEQLKLLIMSATLDSDALLKLLDAPLVSSQGRSFPVDVFHQPDNTPELDRYNLSATISRKVLEALTTHSGNILVFLPGVREIKQLEAELRSALNSRNSQNIHISPLYGDLSKQQQDQAISPPPSGHRKIVLATNIAETSLTIEGINVVIDSGLQRESLFNPGSGMNSLQTTRISRDSAIQRSGRAGRLSAGSCYRLWSQSQHKRLAQHHNAEILNSDLAPLVLELAQWGIQEVSDLHWLDLPPPGAAAQAKELLSSLQALDASGRITTHGQQMLTLGVHPRLAHMILQAKQLKQLELGCLLAALLTEKDILSSRKTADITERVSLLLQFKDNKPGNSQSINKRLCRQIISTAKQYQQRLIMAHNSGQQPHSEAVDINLSGVILAFAYPDRIAGLRNNKDQRYQLSNNKGAFFTAHDTLSSEAFLVIPSLNEQSQQQRREARIFLAASISREQIETHFSSLILHRHELSWDRQRQRVECLSKQMLGSLSLQQQSCRSIADEELYQCLFHGINIHGIECLPWSKAALQLKHRVEFVRYQQQHNQSASTFLAQIELPDFSDEALLNTLEQWLQPHLSQQNSIKKLQTLNLEQILSSYLSWDNLQLLNKLAPEKLAVPSGSNISIDYSDAAAPVLAVRLQELFGLQTTPTVLAGGLPLLLHLLSPASRPMQVTNDLASFWKNIYNDVKKELRGKYKKHYWPDDPLQAQATSRVKPRKR